jgi:hypothetical protein
MRQALLAILMTGILTAIGSGQMSFVEDPARGKLTIRDGKVEVLTYCYGDQLKPGVEAKYTQSCYVHPLFSRDGRPLTDDSPADHLHHHGLFWTWPVVRVRGLSTATWEPKLPRLRQHFVRWLKRETEGDSYALSIENAWRLEGKETVAKEILTVRIHPADKQGRAIDLELTIEAVGGPLELQGTHDQNKGYGGLCFRGAPMFTGAAITTDEGSLNEDVVHTPFRWADLSTRELGIAVFVSPDHPGSPAKWMIRNSYAGIMNVSWPGLASAVLKPGEPVILRYRIYVHNGDAEAADVKAAYRQYLGEVSPAIPLSSILPHQGGRCGGGAEEVADASVSGKAASAACAKGSEQ